MPRFGGIFAIAKNNTSYFVLAVLRFHILVKLTLVLQYFSAHIPSRFNGRYGCSKLVADGKGKGK